MGISTQNPTPAEAKATDAEERPEKREATRQDPQEARGKPGSFDQPESRPEVMPREGGPSPKQTAEVPLGHDGRATTPGSHGHNSPPVVKKDSKSGA